MNWEESWKNFAMGRELDVAGRFIYNGVREFHLLHHFSDAGATFEILYDLSVGIERLQKVALVLLEHDTAKDIRELEKSLVGHDTLLLSNRIDKNRDQALTSAQKEFLALMSDFYRHRRYGRFLLNSVPKMEAEHDALVGYLCKHLQINRDTSPLMLDLPNDNRLREFLGAMLKGIVDGLYRIIKDEARRLNIYTYELQSDSKAMKVFLGTRLDFVGEDLVRRELLLFLVQPNPTKHAEVVRTMEPLELDSALWPTYAKYLLNDTAENSASVKDEVDTIYEDRQDKSERLEMLDLVDNESIMFDEDAPPDN